MNQHTSDSGFLVIDDHFHIVYANQTFKKLYPQILDLTRGCTTCHNVLHGYGLPCPHCPILTQAYDHEVLFNALTDSWVKAEIARIDLPDGRNGYALTVSPVDTDKRQSPLSAESAGTAETAGTAGTAAASLPADPMERHHLLENNSIWNLAVNDMPSGYHRNFDEEGLPILYVSDRFCEIVGFSRAELKERFDNQLLSMVHPDDRHMLDDMPFFLRNDWDNSEYNQYIYRMESKKGYIWVLDSTKLVVLGQERFYQGTITDITAYIESHHEERDSLIRVENKIGQYKKAIISGAQAIYEVNVTRDILESVSLFNKGKEYPITAFFDIQIPCSYTSFMESLSKKMLRDDQDFYFEQNSIETLRKNYREGKLEWQIEYETLSPDKKYQHMRKNFILTRSAVSGDVEVLIVSKNITDEVMERRENEILLKKQKYELAIALNNAEQRLKVIDGLCSEYDAVFYADVRNDVCIPYILPPDSRAFGSLADHKELPFLRHIRSYIEQCVPTEDVASIHGQVDIAVVLRHLEEEGTYHVNFRAMNNGRTEHMQIRIVAIGNKYEQVWAFRSIENIVEEEQKHQAALQAALEKAQKGEKAKTSFLLNMSHDIRTPMNAVIGFNELAQKNIADPARALDFLRKAEIASHHLLNLINDVLEMSRIESGKIEINEQVVNVQEYFAEIREMFAANMQKKGITFVTESEFHESFVYLDITRVMQVIINLLSNAMKFTKSGGTVTYTSKETARTHDGYVWYEIHIRDTGVGMGEEFQKRLFNAFEREENSTTSRITGTGLGLSIAKNIANIMGGTLTCESHLGQGTDFTFKFHARAAKNLKGTSFLNIDEPGDPPDYSGKRLLLVEDNELNREIATEVLSDYGFLIETADDGAVAVKKVAESADGYYDLILMDIQMPYMDGYTATGEIRHLRNRKLAGIPIVAMTANAFAEDRNKAIASGMDDFLPKPIRVPDLIRIISRLLK